MLVRTFGETTGRGATGELHVRQHGVPQWPVGDGVAHGSASGRPWASVCACRSSLRLRCAAGSCSSTVRSPTTSPCGRWRRMGEGPIIAVDVKATFDRPSDGNGRRDSRTAGQRAAAQPRRDAGSRSSCSVAKNTTEATRRHANLVIKPRTPGIGLPEFHQIDAAREAGRAAAREALENGLGAPFR